MDVWMDKSRWMGRWIDRWMYGWVNITATRVYHYSLLYDEVNRMELGEKAHNIVIRRRRRRRRRIMMMSMKYIADKIMGYIVHDKKIDHCKLSYEKRRTINQSVYPSTVLCSIISST